MEIVFIDPEPPALTGGGIRTYLTLSLKICHARGMATRIYTHNPDAYPNANVFLIGRKPILKWPWRGLAYQFQYSQNVLWEHAHWLNTELEENHRSDRIYEFADFLGYGFFALRNPILKNHVLIRVHTPHFLVPPATRSLPALLSSWNCAWREKQCLSLAKYITVPSQEFIGEKLPRLKNGHLIPNPLPDGLSLNLGLGLGLGLALNKATENEKCHSFLYLGRIEPRKGVLPLVSCFLRFALEQPSVTLTLVGNPVPGPYSQQVRNLIDSQSAELRSRFIWKEAISAAQLPELLSQHQVLLVPSLWENSPYVYFEAMAAGLVCLGSATGEMKAAARITHAPSPRPGNFEDWLQALREVMILNRNTLLEAQAQYLDSRKKSIPDLQIAYYRKILDP